MNAWMQIGVLDSNLSGIIPLLMHVPSITVVSQPQNLLDLVQVLVKKNIGATGETSHMKRRNSHPR